MRATLLFSILLAAVCASAQPTLTGPANNPVAGNVFYGHDCSTAGISMGASGAGVTWNFAGLIDQFDDTTTYTACAGTPYCDTFPASSVVVFDGYEYNYYITDAGKFAIAGIGIGSGGSVYYSDPQEAIAYPMTYNSVQVDTYFSSQPMFDDYNFGVDSLIGDAYGTLILPVGTFSNVLRVHIISYYTDSNTTAGSPYVQHSRNEGYVWYTPGFHNQLLTMFYDTSGGGTSLLADVEYYMEPVTEGVKAVVNASSYIQVYPNPANETLHIAVNAPDAAPIAFTIADMTGRNVAEGRFESVHSGLNTLEYNVATLSEGLYLLRVQTGGNTVVKKVSIGR